MNKEIFESAIVEVIVFESEDIITTSGAEAFNIDDLGGYDNANG